MLNPRKARPITYLTNESGAVTVDWVVLTAGLVGLGLATMAVVSTGVQDTAHDIETQLAGTQIMTGFASQTYAGLYDAMNDLHGIGSSRYGFVATAHGVDGLSSAGHNADFMQIVANIQNTSDADLLADIAARDVYDPGRVAMLGQLEAMPTSGLTAADLHEYAYGLNEAGAQALIDSDFGGDTNAFRENLIAEAQFGIALSQANKIVADSRGLTY